MKHHIVPQAGDCQNLCGATEVQILNSLSTAAAEMHLRERGADDLCPTCLRLLQEDLKEQRTTHAVIPTLPAELGLPICGGELTGAWPTLGYAFVSIDRFLGEPPRNPCHVCAAYVNGARFFQSLLNNELSNPTVLLVSGAWRRERYYLVSRDATRVVQRHPLALHDDGMDLFRCRHPGSKREVDTWAAAVPRTREQYHFEWDQLRMQQQRWEVWKVVWHERHDNGRGRRR